MPNDECRMSNAKLQKPRKVDGVFIDLDCGNCVNEKCTEKRGSDPRACPNLYVVCSNGWGDIECYSYTPPSKTEADNVK